MVVERTISASTKEELLPVTILDLWTRNSAAISCRSWGERMTRMPSCGHTNKKWANQDNTFTHFIMVLLTQKVCFISVNNSFASGQVNFRPISHFAFAFGVRLPHTDSRMPQLNAIVLQALAMRLPRINPHGVVGDDKRTDRVSLFDRTLTVKVLLQIN